MNPSDPHRNSNVNKLIPTDADGRPIRSGTVIRARTKSPIGAWQLIPKADWMKLSQEEKQKLDVLHGEDTVGGGGSAVAPRVIRG